MRTDHEHTLIRWPRKFSTGQCMVSLASALSSSCFPFLILYCCTFLLFTVSTLSYWQNLFHTIEKSIKFQLATRRQGRLIFKAVKAMASLSSLNLADGDQVAALIDRVNGITVNEETSGKTKDGQNGLQDGLQKRFKASEIDAKQETGMAGDIKEFYQGHDDYGDVTWTDKYPSNLEEPVENAETARHTLLVRKKKSKDIRKKLELDSIVVQSPLIKRCLASVLRDYPGVTTELERLEFEAPFEPFMHRWTGLERAVLEEPDRETKEHLMLLWKVLDNEFEETIKRTKDLVANGVMDYTALWTVFEPGTMVFTLINGQERVLRLRNGCYSCGSYQLCCDFVQWDGERFGLASTTLLICQFRGTTPIIDLEAFPLAYHPKRGELESCLKTRGRTFETHCGYQYRAYTGLALDNDDCKYNVNSRVIIDTAAFNLFNPNRSVRVTELPKIAKPDITPVGAKQARRLSDVELLLCTDMFRAYSLSDKRWFRIFVDNVTDIVWDDKAFQSLVLPEDQKELILAFADSQVKMDHQFDDVIRGKGKGIIILLSSPPGVGKTLTAESVAEEMRTPLYMLSAGDLGTAPGEVESALTKILSMTTKWKAVLLLDEADVFLEARSTHDLERNKLISIFLRILEYYQGFFFLTTNRVDNIDAAFRIPYSHLLTVRRAQHLLSSAGLAEPCQRWARRSK